MTSGDRFPQSRRLLREDLDLGDVPVLFGVVETVADHELRVDREADVIGLELDFPRGRLIQKRGGDDAGGAAALDVAEDFAHRQPAVDDVLDDENGLAVHVELRLLQDGDHARRILLVPIRGNLDEVECDVHADLAHQVAAEEHRALEDAAGHQLGALEVFGDLAAHLSHPLVDLFLAD